MKQLIIIIAGMFLATSMTSQNLVKIWEGQSGQKFQGDLSQYLNPNKGSASDYTLDGISDIVLYKKNSRTLFIIDGKTRKPVDSLEIDVTASLCNNEVIELFHASFIRLEPISSQKTTIITRRVNGRLLGTRNDNNVVMSGGSTMITVPCDYQLKGFLEVEEDGYYTLMLENLTDQVPSIWAIE